MPELALSIDNEYYYKIPYYDGLYSISDIGSIYDHIHKCKLIIGPRKSKYIVVGLIDLNGNRQGRLLHRLVASAFLGLDLSDATIQVDHIDGNTRNNSLLNLRLCTASQNVQWSKGIGDNDTITHKQCRCCLEIKPRSRFHNGGTSVDKIKAYCNDCRAEENFDYRVSIKGLIPKDYDTGTHKYCRSCEQLKHRSEFGLKSSSKDGLQSYCKMCVNSKYK